MNFLITGGSGLVGSAIIQQLLDQGHIVYNLTTNKELNSPLKNLRHTGWQPSKGTTQFDLKTPIDAVINLAGYSVSNRWTESNMRIMIESRLQSTHFLMKIIEGMETKPTVVVNASAVGCYASSDALQDESASVVDTFLGELTQKWEAASLPLQAMNIRRVVLRIGVVLDPQQGAIGKMAPIFKLGLGAAIGSGKQWMSWIHVDDLAAMFIYCAQHPVSGVYNAVADSPVTNKEFSKQLAKALGKPFFLPNAPEWAIRLLFGEMTQMLTVSHRISNDRIKASGFKFTHHEVLPALQTLFQR